MKNLMMSSMVAALIMTALSPEALALTEKDFESSYDAQVRPFMEKAQVRAISTFDGLNLSAAYFKHSKPKGIILAVNGRTETWSKWGETLQDLHRMGYSVISYDHRGQGLSPRLIKGNPQIGFVNSINDYVSDLGSVIDQLVLPIQKKKTLKVHVVSHSLGGLIVAGYLEKNKDSVITSVVMSAPLFGMFSGTETLDDFLNRALAQIEQGLGEEYFPGRANYNPAAPFAPNPLTTSEVRFTHQAKLAKELLQTIVGGQSNRWMAETIQASRGIVGQARSIGVPVLMFQAGNDRIAEPTAQDSFCQATECVKLVYPESKHHFFLENDSIRSDVLTQIELFLTSFQRQ